MTSVTQIDWFLHEPVKLMILNLLTADIKTWCSLRLTSKTWNNLAVKYMLEEVMNNCGDKDIMVRKQYSRAAYLFQQTSMYQRFYPSLVHRSLFVFARYYRHFTLEPGSNPVFIWLGKWSAFIADLDMMSFGLDPSINNKEFLGCYRRSSHYFHDYGGDLSDLDLILLKPECLARPRYLPEDIKNLNIVTQYDLDNMLLFGCSCILIDVKKRVCYLNPRDAGVRPDYQEKIRYLDYKRQNKFI
jgi:hypothetical protein